LPLGLSDSAVEPRGGGAGAAETAEGAAENQPIAGQDDQADSRAPWPHPGHSHLSARRQRQQIHRLRKKNHSLEKRGVVNC